MLPAGGKTGFVKITGKVTSDMKEAVEDVDLIMLVVPSHVRESFIRSLAPHVEDGQTIVVWPGYFGALLVARIFKDMGVEKDVTICETESLIYTCKRTRPAQVFVKGKKDRLLLSVFPASRTAGTIEHLKKIFPKFLTAQNVLETTFANGNPTLHSQSVLLNMYRVERKFYPYFKTIDGLMYSSYDITPGMTAIACAATDSDYWSKGLTMEKLGLADKTAEEIIEYVNTGK